MAKRKMRFAARPANTPGPDESHEMFAERMAATGNVDALDTMNADLDRGMTYEEYRTKCNDEV